MRLTNEIRYQIKKKVVVATFKARNDALRLDEEVLGLRVRNTVLTPSEITIVDSLPSKFFSGTYLQAAWMLGKNSRYAQLRVAGNVNLPSHISGRAHLVDEALALDIQTWKDQIADLKKDDGVFQAQTEAILATYTSSDKLLAAWPTIRDVMGAEFFEEPAKVQLPATLIDSLDLALKAGIAASAAA